MMWFRVLSALTDPNRHPRHHYLTSSLGTTFVALHFFSSPHVDLRFLCLHHSGTAGHFAAIIAWVDFKNTTTQ